MNAEPSADAVFPNFFIVGAMKAGSTGRENQTHRPRSVWLQWFLSKALFHRNTNLYYRLASFTSHPDPGYPPMAAELRQELAEFYAPHNQALAQLTVLDLSHWDAPGPAT